jgi:hypothetical protein
MDLPTGPIEQPKTGTKGKSWIGRSSLRGFVLGGLIGAVCSVTGIVQSEYKTADTATQAFVVGVSLGLFMLQIGFCIGLVGDLARWFFRRSSDPS